MNQSMIAVEGLTKSFGRTQAVDDDDLGQASAGGHDVVREATLLYRRSA